MLVNVHELTSGLIVLKFEYFTSSTDEGQKLKVDRVNGLFLQINSMNSDEVRVFQRQQNEGDCLL